MQQDLTTAVFITSRFTFMQLRILDFNSRNNGIERLNLYLEFILK